MSEMRVTQRSIADRTLAGLQANLGRVAGLQHQLSSGRLIAKPSDSPTGTVAAMQIRSDIRSNESWSRNASDGIGWLGTIDQALTSSMDSVRRVRDLTLTGLNSGATGPQAREALAAEVDQLYNGLLGLANTRYLDRPVFGGPVNGSQAYDAGALYLGPATTVPIHRTVGAGALVRVDQSGPEVFGPTGGDLFAVLRDISVNLRAGNTTALQSDLGDLDVAMNRITGKLAEVGAGYNRLEQMRASAQDKVLALRSALAEIEDIDLPKTIVELELAQVAQNAALAATQRVITPSLVDFLR
ncbi:MAG: flagellin N-terminal helical domain-containing protein [Sporichthyaceae bacterium]